MRDKIFAIKEVENNIAPTQGRGEKGVLFVIRSDESGQQTIADLLTAIKLDVERDVYMMYIPKDDKMSIINYLVSNNIKRMVSFGFTPYDLGFNINSAYYYPYTLDAVTLLFSESIETLNSDKSKKMNLWKALQNIFLS